MGRKALLDLTEQEELAECARKYPCLYDKTSKHYKDRTIVENAWAKVDKELGNESGESKSAFQNLKKSYSKKRNNLKKAKRSGAGSKDIQKYEKQLEKCAFLSWLNHFVSLRDDTQNNLTNGQDSAESSDNDDDDDSPSNAESVTSVATLASNKRKIQPTRDAESRFNSSRPDTSSKGQTCTAKETGKSQTPTEPPRSKYRINERKAKKPNVDDVSVEALKAITKRLTEKDPTATPQVDKRDEDEVFGQMVTTELKGLSQEFKIRLKHGISNLIFQYQMVNLQQDKARKQRGNQQTTSIF